MHWICLSNKSNFTWFTLYIKESAFGINNHYIFMELMLEWPGRHLELTWPFYLCNLCNRTHCNIDLIKEKQIKPLEVYNNNAIRREISSLFQSGGPASGFNFWIKNWSFKLHNDVRQLVLWGEVCISTLAPSCPAYWLTDLRRDISSC